MTVQIEHGDYRVALANCTADLIATSPPYNIGSKSPRRDGFRKKGKYDPKSYGAITGYADNLPEDEYQQQQAEFLVWAAQHLNEGGLIAYNHKPRRKDGILLFPHQWLLREEVMDVLAPMEEIIWDRGSTHNHSNRMMWPTTERLYVFRRRQDRYVFLNTSSLSFRSDVWNIPLNSRSQKSGHNAPFPSRFALAAIEAFSEVGQTVMDPYTGSGTTALAAKELGRNFIGAELDRTYYDLAVERAA